MYTGLLAKHCHPAGDTGPHRNRFSAAAVLALTAILTLVPPLIVVLTLWYHAIDLPLSDDWDVFVPMVLKFAEGHFPLLEILTPAIEHSLVVPKLIILLVAYFTSYDARYESYLSVLFAASILALFGYLLYQLKNTVGNRTQNLALITASFLVFSYNQWCIFSFPESFMFVLCDFFVMLGFVLMSSSFPLTSRRVFLAAVCGFVAVLSYAPGVSFWLIELYFMRSLFRRGYVEEFRLRQWRKLTLIACVLFFLKPSLVLVPSVYASESFLLSIGRMPLFFFAFLGSPVVPSNSFVVPGGDFFREFMAVVAGILVLLVAMYTVRRMYGSRVRPEQVIPCHAFVVFTLVVAVIASVARQRSGVRYALESRYLPTVNVMWLGVLLGLFTLANIERRKPLILACSTFFIVTAIVLAGVSFNGRKCALNLYGRMTEACEALDQGDYNAFRDKTYVPKEVDVMAILTSLQRHGFSLYREGYKPLNGRPIPPPHQ